MVLTVHLSAFLWTGSGARRRHLERVRSLLPQARVSGAGMDPACFFPGAADRSMEAHSIIQARLVRSGQSSGTFLCTSRPNIAFLLTGLICLSELC